MIRVAVDAMGGDRGPREIVAGALDAASDTVQPVIVGPAGLDTQGLELIEAPDVIAMDEKPTDAVRAKPKSSLVADGKLRVLARERYRHRLSWAGEPLHYFAVLAEKRADP